MANFVLRLLVGFVPVVLFLGALIYLDSYKLVRLRSVILTLVTGCLIAGLSYAINSALIPAIALDPLTYSRYIAPLIEETLKALFLIYLIRSHRIGFLVDAAIQGFAIGTGFAVVENVYYLRFLSDAPVSVWLVRGCGTAIMHGGATAIFAISSKALSERENLPPFLAYIPGLAIACIVHSVFNHFFFSPLFSAVLMLAGLPPLLWVVFGQSERSLEDWLDVGFDADTELLELINSGEFSKSRVGQYLHSLKEKFRGEVVADMLCYLRLHVELSLRAKGLLLMRESGFSVAPDDATREKFAELEYLDKSIGRTGKLAMAPFLHIKGKNLWQLHMLGK